MEIKDENLQDFILAGIITAADKFISEKDSENVREWITMTKVEKIFEKKKWKHSTNKQKKSMRKKI
ncbi:MAG: hypothetical protein FWC47_06305 [Oscillospiraceae bacterium]|nr:hypothetical protein [Oscillospiraceae bacterium]